MEGGSRRLSGSFDVVFPSVCAAAFALAALFVHLRFFPIGDIGVESDFYQSLARAAQELWDGGLSIASYPYKGPFYSFALAFVHLFGGDWYTSGVVLSLICSAAGIVILYRLLLRLFDRRLAVTATVAASLIPSVFMNAHKASTDQLFLFLCLLAISMLLVERWRPRAFIGAGIVSGLAFLTRYNGAYLVMAAAVVALLVDPWGWSRRRRITALAIYVAVFLLVCAPWFALNWVETGRVLETENLRNVTEEFYGGARQSDIPEGGFASIGSIVAHDPAYFAGHYLLNIPRHLWYDAERSLGFRMGIPAALGLLLLLLAPPTRRQWAFYSFGIVYFLSMCIVFRLPRFVLPLAPAYAALGLSFLVGPVGARRSRLGRAVGDRFFSWVALPARSGSAVAKRTVAVVIAGTFVLQILGIVESERWFIARVPTYVLPAAGSLRVHAEQHSDNVAQEVVLARKPHIAYYAGMRYERYPLHLEGDRELLTFAVERNVDYIVYSRIERMYYEDSAWLADLAVVDGVSRVLSDESIIIFEVAKRLDLDEAEGARRLTALIAELERLDDSGDTDATVRAFREMSMLYSYNGNPMRAGDCLARAVRAAQADPDRERAGPLVRTLMADLMSLSRTYFRLGRDSDGAELLENWLTEFEGLLTQSELKVMHTILSMHYTRQNQEADALRHAEEARRASAAVDDRSRS